MNEISVRGLDFLLCLRFVHILFCIEQTYFASFFLSFLLAGVIPRSFLTDSEHPMPTCSSTSAELEKTYDVMRSSEDCNGHPNLVLTQEQPAFVEGKSISEGTNLKVVQSLSNVVLNISMLLK